MARYELEYEAEPFEFWSRGEIVRVCAIAGLAILPVSMASLGGHHGAPAQSTAAVERAVTGQAGQLRMVRTVDFDLSRTGLAAMGDVDDAER
jgi:hypothetical protein